MMSHQQKMVFSSYMLYVWYYHEPLNNIIVSASTILNYQCRHKTRSQNQRTDHQKQKQQQEPQKRARHDVGDSDRKGSRKRATGRVSASEGSSNSAHREPTCDCKISYEQQRERQEQRKIVTGENNLMHIDESVYELQVKRQDATSTPRWWGGC